MLQEFVDLNNRPFARFSAEERRNIGIHTCPGGDCDSVHSKEVPYALLLEHMFDMNAGYFRHQPALPPRSRPPSTCATSCSPPPSTSPRPASAPPTTAGSRRFSRDLKPQHGSPDFGRDVAMQKISARLGGCADGL